MLKRVDIHDLDLTESKYRASDYEFIDIENNKYESRDKLESLIINNLSIQIGLAHLYDSYLLIKLIENRQIPSTFLDILRGIDEEEQINTYSMIFKNMKLCFLNNELTGIAYADLGADFYRVIDIYESLIKSKLLNEHVLSNFIRPIVLEDNHADYKYYEYIDEGDVLLPEIEDDFIDIFLNSKNDIGNHITFSTYKNPETLEKEGYLRAWSKKCEKVYPFQYSEINSAVILKLS